MQRDRAVDRRAIHRRAQRHGARPRAQAAARRGAGSVAGRRVGRLATARPVETTAPPPYRPARGRAATTARRLGAAALRLPRGQLPVAVQRNLAVPMPDGVTLLADRYFPADSADAADSAGHGRTSRR